MKHIILTAAFLLISTNVTHPAEPISPKNNFFNDEYINLKIMKKRLFVDVAALSLNIVTSIVNDRWGNNNRYVAAIVLSTFITKFFAAEWVSKPDMGFRKKLIVNTFRSLIKMGLLEQLGTRNLTSVMNGFYLIDICEDLLLGDHLVKNENLKTTFYNTAINALATSMALGISQSIKSSAPKKPDPSRSYYGNY